MMTDSSAEGSRAKPLHVGLNLIFLVPGKTGGMEIYARELIAAYRRVAPELKLTTFINRELQAAKDQMWLDGTERVVLPIAAKNRVQWVLGEQLLLPRAAARAGVDVLHSLSSTSPATGSFRRIVTILDLHYKLFPETHSGWRSYGMRVLVPAAARTAHRIIAISQTTANDVTRFLRIPAEKIDVVHLGFGTTALARPLGEQELRNRFALGRRRVLLTMAAKRPHKNLMRLLEALASIPVDRRPVLVMPGYATGYEQKLKRRAQQLAITGDVRSLGWISAEEAEGLYALAAAFIFPSLYEGFGLPVLEAMARGLPVACSDRGSLKEVAGNAALLFDPEDTNAISAAIDTIMSDDKEMKRLRAAGKERVGRFSWDKTARETIASYKKALNACS